MAIQDGEPFSLNLGHPEILRSLLAQILGTGDVLGHEPDGRIRLAVSVDGWLFDELATLEADLAELELEPDEEDDPLEDEDGTLLYLSGL